jgi:hypothetical protein
MNSMNDKRFFDLAMKVIASQATDAEHAELDALLVREPGLKAEFARLQADVRMTKNALPLVDATQATAGELPAYARGRLQTKVRQTFGRPGAATEPDRSLAWGWRWVLGLAAATAVVVLLVALPMFRTPSAPVIQLAMLDTTGGTRGTGTSEAALLREAWSTASLDSFTNAEALREWETNGKPNTVKIIYDHAAAEVKVLGYWRGKTFEKTFLIETDLAAVLQQAKSFVGEQTKQ